MELQGWLMLCGVGLAGVAAVLLLMGLFSASGTSYEEAIAQQRKATTELLSLAESKNKAKKTNKKEKKEKKLAKKEKVKENAPAANSSDIESEAPAESGMEDDSVPPEKPHVEFSPPIVVDVSRDTPPAVKIRKRGKDPKVKPILLNKEDPSCVSDPSSLPPTVTVSNRFEEMHPKDEFELLQSSLTTEKIAEKKEEVVDKKESKPAKAAKGAKVAAKAAPVEDVAKAEAAGERQAASEVPKEQRKAKKVEKKQVSEETSESGKEESVPPLNVPQPSELTTEKLLKQAMPPAAAPAPSPPATKNKKKKPEPNVLTLMAAGDGGGVNVGELVRVIREAALSRTEIQILTDALLNKHHDPLPEHSEWTEGPNDPMQKLKKQLADKEKALADEVEASQALHAKLKELRASLNAERGRAAAATRASEQAAAALRAEQHTLQTRLQRLLDDNHMLAQEKLHLQSKLGAEGEAQAQRVQMEMHIQRLTEAENSLVQQLAALQAELNARIVEAGQARMDAGAAREAMIIAQQHTAELAQQLQEANRAYSEMEQQRQCAAHAEQLAQQELREAQERLNATSELQNEVQRLTSRAQTAEGSLEKLKEETEKQKQQLSSELASLREQLAARESEMAELKQLKAAPAQNGLPAANDQHKAGELAMVEGVVSALRSELASAQAASREQRAELARLADQLQAYQTKNNEAIEKAQVAQYNEVANVLRAACPAAAPGSAAGRDWLQAFADNLKKELEKKEAEKRQLEKKLAESHAASDSNERIEDLKAQNEHLQSLVDKYKRIIDDTEGVLSRLQQNVSAEEARWAAQLADKQRELDELRARTVLQMQNKIDTLTVELQKAQAAGHNNSFADAERLTQERLMGGQPDKMNLDVSNGPLQVGLDSK
ncbi:hypothetical protein ABMA27_007404 [Loxostege sticticalis]|uniref:Ribosome-binding protein 1 n=1 Tax=Loxostege sticticalis TaxID=481309 RepID=A0ABR3HFB3_LOXSC